MNDKTRQLQLYRELGAKLEESGRWFKKNAFKIDYKIISSSVLKDKVKDTLGKTPYLADSKYRLTDWPTIKQVLKYDWTDKKKYLKDFFDCDNFADYLNANMALTYGLNSFGRFTCNGIKSNGERFKHRASIVLASNLNLYVIEPQTDYYVIVEKNKPIEITQLGWRLEPVYLEFN